MTKSKDILKEIIHRPITFTANTIEKDTVELNKAISQGYLIHDSIRTETGIVYVLAKWEKQDSCCDWYNKGNALSDLGNQESE